MMNRRLFLKLAGLGYLSARSKGEAVANESSMRIFSDDRWNASIRIAPQAGRQTRDAASLLAQYLQRSTGRPIPTTGSLKDDKQIVIQVGASPDVPRTVAALASLDPDGFLIDFPDQRTIVIAGPSEWGTEFGVYEFLERFIGVRWLLPGPVGDYVPTVQTLEIPTKPVRQQPAFFSRALSGLSGEAQTTWARRQRLHGRLNFHHNLLNLFPPEQYTKTHPEFFPIIKGRRFLPPDNKTQGWQPCFSAKGIEEEAIKNIRAYFSQRPAETSYSLAVNDSGGHCECPECAKQEKKNFLGYHDSSDVYYAWVNRVVNGVLEKYPDKWFGCLAYREVAQPPSQTSVHPRVVPYLTYDRMKWVDPAIAAEGHRITEWWRTKAQVLGWYDYIYGTPYCVPRVYPHAMADYYRYGAKQGVRAMYAEAYPNWGEGPKLYIALKLQWDPSLNVDVLLQEWCEKAVGNEAAAELGQYYRLWEQFWTVAVPRTTWFRTSRGEYLYFMVPGYLDALTNEVARSKQLLESVVAKTKTAEQRARAMLLSRAFAYYEVSANSYMASRNPTKSQGAEDIAKKAREQRLSLVDEFAKDPVLQHPLRFDQYKTLQW